MTKKVAAPKPEETITSYKGFNKDWKCRDFQFAVGQTFVHEGAVKACEGGFHACEYPLDVFAYYSPADSRFAVVQQSGQLSRHSDDTKVASKSLTVSAEINLAGLVKAAIAYTISKCGPIDPESPSSATGYGGASSATGTRGASSATGDGGASSATGYGGASSATGDGGASSATGYGGASSATGDGGASSATGYGGASSATGYGGASSATGYGGASSATGYGGASSATGDGGASSATGYGGASSATGDGGASSATGYGGASSATGPHSVAMATGFYGKAMAGDTAAIVLVNRNDDGSIRHIRASKVGENGIVAGTWYTLDENGEFAEAA